MREVKLRLPHTDASTYIHFSVFDENEVYNYDAVELSKMPFIMSDITQIIRGHEIKGISSVVIIHAIHVYKNDRGNDYGFRLFGDLLRYLDDHWLRDRHKEKEGNAIILIKANPLMIDYPDEPDRDTHKKEIASQSKWLEIHGFRNINSLCNFDNSAPYMYINTDSYDVLHAIIEEEVDKYY